MSDVVNVENDQSYHLQVLLLSPCEVEHFIGIFQQDRPFGLRLGDIQWTCENTNFGSGKFLDHS